MGIQDIIGFDFIDPPSTFQIEEALGQLFVLGALSGPCDANREVGSITTIGLEMSRLPLDPVLSRMVVEAKLPQNDCLFEILCIAAMISSSADEIFYRQEGGNNIKHDKKRRYDEIDKLDMIQSAHSKLRHPLGDHFTYIKVLCTYEISRNSTSDTRIDWCHQNYVHSRPLKMALNIRDQLFREVGLTGADSRVGYRLEGNIGNNIIAAISRCLVSGLCMNVARFVSQLHYFKY